jgi:hypothetical protein
MDGAAKADEVQLRKANGNERARAGFPRRRSGVPICRRVVDSRRGSQYQAVEIEALGCAHRPVALATNSPAGLKVCTLSQRVTQFGGIWRIRKRC